MTQSKKVKANTAAEASEVANVEVQIPEKQDPPHFPVVGIGASAGGLAAFEAFFSGMPADFDSGMAFVLVQHLAPDHKSILTELVRRYTRMQVFEVEDGMVVQPNCAYIIPPNRDMAFLNGTLQLLEPSSPRGQRLPIDFFFRSLAADQHERAICIVLSGTGSDGTLGVRAIKGEGGMVMAQNPESTEHDGMPRTAIATGMVDYILPPAEMPAQLIAYADQAFGKGVRPATAHTFRSEDAMKKIFVLLRAQTGHDFSLYKPNTINRRVERRMAVLQIAKIEEYIRYLKQTPAAVQVLFEDILINVTSFFRDTEAFKALEETAIPAIFQGRQADAAVRVWVPGCSTGEEPYSIAILLQEKMEALKQNFKLQVFATDIDAKAVELARTGHYSTSIAADMSPERLSRFFVQDPAGGYRVSKLIRDILIFSEQDLIKDPPFSKLDLVSCRNLLIYMGGELQKKIMPLFHFALNPKGVLFLGTSESVGEYHELFAPLDRQAKLYQRKDAAWNAHIPMVTRYSLPLVDSLPARTIARSGMDKRVPLREIAERALLKHYGAVGVLVSERGDILYLHGHAGQYLEPLIGEQVVNNILKMARKGLLRELTAALHKAVVNKEPVAIKGVRVKTNGDFTLVDLTVQPVTTGFESATGEKLLLVILADCPAQAPVSRSRTHPRETDKTADEESVLADAAVETLRRELHIKEEYLQSANEELETANEELKSANEEMQSVNEELQSTNEELETSKEELQSVNEELSTVNSELQAKVSDLSRANNDINNLLASTNMGTVFVDHQLRIQRFTPAVTQVINLIQADVGRPVGHIVSNLVGYDSLVEDVLAVLSTLTPREMEVRSKTGDIFLLRIRPYRSLENVIEGAVISFFDITEMKRTEAAFRENEAKLRTVFDKMPQGVIFLGREGRISDANSAAARITGLSIERLRDREFAALMDKAVQENGSPFPENEQPVTRSLQSGASVQGIVMGVQFPGKAGVTWIRVNSEPQFHQGETLPYQVFITLEEVQK